MRLVLLHLDQVRDFLRIVARSPGSGVEGAERPLVRVFLLLIEYGYVEVVGLGYGCGRLGADDDVLTHSRCYKGLRKLTAHLRVDLVVIG